MRKYVEQFRADTQRACFYFLLFFFCSFASMVNRHAIGQKKFIRGFGEGGKNGTWGDMIHKREIKNDSENQKDKSAVLRRAKNKREILRKVI